MSNFTFNPKGKSVYYLGDREKDSSFSSFFENGIGRLLTVRDVAKILQCSEGTIRNWVWMGAIPTVRPSGVMVRFSPAALSKWLSERRQK